MKTYLMLICHICCGVVIFAQSSHEISIRNAKVSSDGTSLTVGFDARIGSHFATRNYQYICTPIIVNMTDTFSLPPIIVRGRNKELLVERQKRAGEYNNEYPDALMTSNNANVEYLAQIPADITINDASLLLKVMKEGCCTTEYYQTTPIETVFSYPVDEEIVEEIVVEEEPEIKIATMYYKFGLQFKISSAVILADYGNNRQELEKMHDVLSEQLSIDSQSQIERIEIIGFASPEGSTAFNNRLAQSRTNILKEYILKHFPAIPATAIFIRNGDVDWDGLEALIAASTMDDRDVLLDLIRTSPKDSALNDKIKHLNDGATYRYLLKNFYPQLRSVYAIDIFYTEHKNHELYLNSGAKIISE
ncbi:MAG: DUF3868 domain-containing protein [Tannerellaceae bacterium]